MVCVNRLEKLKNAIGKEVGCGVLYLSSLSVGFYSNFLWLMYVLFLFHTLVIPEKLVELIRRDYKSAALCPFPWCENELQLKLSNIFTRLQIVIEEKNVHN